MVVSHMLYRAFPSANFYLAMSVDVVSKLRRLAEFIVRIRIRGVRETPIASWPCWRAWLRYNYYLIAEGLG